jgi:hypothetical protein
VQSARAPKSHCVRALGPLECYCSLRFLYLVGADSNLGLRLIETGSYRRLAKGERGFQLELDPASWFDLHLRG